MNLKASTLIALLSIAISSAITFAAPQNEPSRTPVANESVQPDEEISSGWRQSADCVARMSSLSVLTLGFVPQTVSAAITSAIRAADIPGHICNTCLALGDAIHGLGSAIVNTVKETVHWLALPIHIFRALLEELPVPEVAGNDSHDRHESDGRMVRMQGK
jgi:hypothetical protein